MCSMHIKTDELVRLMRGVDGNVLDLWVTWAASNVEVVDVLLSSFFGWCGLCAGYPLLSCVVWIAGGVAAPHSRPPGTCC